MDDVEDQNWNAQNRVFEKDTEKENAERKRKETIGEVTGSLDAVNQVIIIILLLLLLLLPLVLLLYFFIDTAIFVIFRMK